MGRHGDLYDQDRDDAGPERPNGPRRAGRGVLYDQDSPPPEARPDPRSLARQLRDQARQREREIELRREANLSGPPPGPPGPTPRDPRAASAWTGAAPLRISSRSTPLRPPGPTTGLSPGAPVPAPGPPAPSTGAPPGGDTEAGPAGGGAAPRPGPATAPRYRAGRHRRSLAARWARTTGRAQSTGEATAVIAAGTFASRITGFIRVLAIGYVLGVSSLSDAFNYANGVPNIVYDLLLGGILSATLIPVFVDQLAKDDPEDRARSVSAVVTAIGAALVAMSGLLWLLAPWVIRFYLLLSSTSTGPAEREVATRLLHYFAPQVFLLGAIVVSTALLNARHRFTAAAFSPVLNNLVAIAALLVTKFVASGILTARHATPSATLTAFGRDQRAILILGLGTTAGYLVQLAAQLPGMRRAGLRVRLVWDLRHPAVRQVARLSSWLIGVVAVNQASLALVMVLAGKTQGGVTAYQFSYQFFQLPYALIAVSVASAIMPDLAERWTAGDRVEFERRFITGLRVTLALLIPVSWVYMAVAQPFIQIAIQHGRVTQSGAHLVSTSLLYFAAGLPGFAAFFLLMRAYQAMQDARTMFWIYLVENAMTLVAAPFLSLWLGVPGLALAWVGPYTIGSVFAVYRLRRRVGPLGGWLTIRAIMRILIASGATAGVVVAVGLPFRSRGGDAVAFARLAVQVAAGAAVYLYLARVLRIRELRPVMAMARRLVGGR